MRNALFVVTVSIMTAFLATIGCGADFHVSIPYQPPRTDGEWSGGTFEYKVVVGKKYQFVLEVERAPWDSVGVAGAVPVFLGIKEPDSGEKGANTKGVWKVSVVYKASKTGTATSVYSTLAPLGASGKLTITQVE